MTRTSAPAIAILAIGILFSSCATLFNSRVQTIHIATDSSIKQLSIDHNAWIDSSLTNKAKGYRDHIVMRSKAPLTLHFRLDTADVTVLLPSRNSLAYWSNIGFNYGVGMLLEMNSPKRYKYASWIYLSAHDTIVRRRRFPPVPKGSLRFSLGLSPINIFSLRSPLGQYYTGGVFGLDAGLDYFYKKDRYLSLSIGAGSDAQPENFLFKRASA